MIKVEVIKRFDLKEFDKLKNIERKSVDVKGTLFVGDKFECDEEMAKYLTGNNPIEKIVVKVIEVIPEKEEKTYKKEPIIDETKTETVKPKKKKSSKK